VCVCVCVCVCVVSLFFCFSVISVSVTQSGESSSLLIVPLPSSANRIGAKGAKVLLDALTSNSVLTSLAVSLYGNRLGKKGARNVAQSFSDSSNTNLQSLLLDLGKTELGSESVLIAEVLGRNASLKSLSLMLAANQLQPVDAHRIALALAASTSLHSLYADLAQNRLAEHGMKPVLDAFVSNTSISHLHLNLAMNYAHSVGIQQLAESLPQFSSLDCLHVHLGFNTPDPRSTETEVPAEMKVPADHLPPLPSSPTMENTTLRLLKLFLTGNKCGPHGIKAFVNVLSRSTSLTTLNLSLQSTYHR